MLVRAQYHGLWNGRQRRQLAAFSGSSLPQRQRHHQRQPQCRSQIGQCIRQPTHWRLRSSSPSAGCCCCLCCGGGCCCWPAPPALLRLSSHRRGSNAHSLRWCVAASLLCHSDRPRKTFHCSLACCYHQVGFHRCWTPQNHYHHRWRLLGASLLPPLPAWIGLGWVGWTADSRML